MFLGRFALDAFSFRRLLDQFLLDQGLHRLGSKLLQQFELVTPRADLNAFRVAILDVESLEPLVADGLVVDAHRIARIDALRLRRARCDDERQ